LLGFCQMVDGVFWFISRVFWWLLGCCLVVARVFWFVGDLLLIMSFQPEKYFTY